ncbi:MAG: trimethylamine methyltransferase family protein [Thermodesulfobacteriota bacterium]
MKRRSRRVGCSHSNFFRAPKVRRPTMIGSYFSFYSSEQVQPLRDKVLDFLENHGMKLDEHPEMIRLLAEAGAKVDQVHHLVRFPKPLVEKCLEQAPREFILGARGQEKTLPLPRPDGTFYGRTVTGAHGWIEPETGAYRKVTSSDLVQWTRLVNHLDEISFMPFLFANDVPTATADIYGLATVLTHTDKHVWVQPYSTGSVEYLLELAATVAGGEKELRANPLVSMIACSLTPRSFKYMDLEIILRSARAGVAIQACSLPGAGGTAPATLPGVILLAVAEILAMLVMAQAAAPGTPVIACPIIFSTDMRTGRSLQSSVEAIAAASGAVQFIKAAFNLPTHNYGSGSDAPNPGAECLAQRVMLGTLMALSGSDILGGAGQLEVATAVSPLVLIADNEIMALLRRLRRGFILDDDQLALDVMAETPPGQHFLTSLHTLKHCRDAFPPRLFLGLSREAWRKAGEQDLLERALVRYRDWAVQDNPSQLGDDLAKELKNICQAADLKLAG